MRFWGNLGLVGSTTEEVRQKFQKWVVSLKNQVNTHHRLPEDAVESLQSLIQDLDLEVEKLPELFSGLKAAEEKVAEGSFYSPQDEIDFLVRRCLFLQLCQKLQEIPEQILMRLCYSESKNAQDKSTVNHLHDIIQVVVQKLSIVDPSCGAGDFLMQYARIVIDWIARLNLNAGKQEEISLLLLNRIAGVDSDPVAVVITRVRLLSFFTKNFGQKSKDNWAETARTSINATIAWGNALGGELAGDGPDFAWGVTFSQILGDGGFNIVIGNPPYIRQEDIASSQEAQDKPWRSRKLDQRGRRENRKYKSDLLARLSSLAHLDTAALSSKADLSAYFFLLAKYLCGKDGVCGYITPNAWLDVQYGFQLQEFLTNHTTLLGLYERKFFRAFTTAAINTIITVFIPNPSNNPSKSSVRVECLSVGTDYKDYYRSISIEKIHPQKQLKFHNIKIRAGELPNKGSRRELSVNDLYSLGKEDKNRNYQGFKWGSLLFRAPDFFFELRDQLGAKMVPFLDVIDLNFGLKTGKNAFFVVPNKNVQVKQIGQSYFLEIPDAQKIAVPEGVIKPIIVSSRHIANYILDEETGIKYLVHITGELPRSLAPFVSWGKHRKYHLAPSCQAHHPQWYNLPQQRSPDFIFFRFMDQRMWVPVNRGQLLFSDNFFIGYAKDLSYVKPCSAYFNSTLHLFFSEIWGRTGLGEGLLTFYGPDYRFLEILDPRNLDDTVISTLDKLFSKLAEQPVQPILEDLQNPARIALDTFIMEDILNLPKSYRPQLYDTFRALVTQRLGRAKRKILIGDKRIKD